MKRGRENEREEGRGTEDGPIRPRLAVTQLPRVRCSSCEGQREIGDNSTHRYYRSNSYIHMQKFRPGVGRIRKSDELCAVVPCQHMDMFSQMQRAMTINSIRWWKDTL